MLINIRFETSAYAARTSCGARTFVSHQPYIKGFEDDRMLAHARRLVHSLRRTVNYSSTESVNGKVFRIPRIFGTAHIPSEPWMSDVLRRVLPLKQGAFLDVGVNVGQTLLKLRSLDDRPYVGFEPNPLCVLYAQELVKQNALQECMVVPAGLFTSDQVLTLNLYDDSVADSSASLIAEFRQQPVSRMTVPVYRWETVAPAIGQSVFGVVKIDVEGAELEVVQTLRPMLAQQRPFVLIEILPCYSADSPRLQRQLELEVLFRDTDYHLLRVLKDKDEHFIGIAAVESIGVHGDMNLCDYVAAPSEMVGAIRGA